MSEDILPDPPPEPPDRPEAPPPAPAENDAAENAAAENARRRPRARGGRGRRGSPGSMDGEADEAGPDEIAEATTPSAEAVIGPREAPADSPAPANPPAPPSPEPRSPGDRRDARDTRDPRDPRDPRRDVRAQRPDPRPPRPETRDHRRELRPPRPEHREPRQDRPPRPDRSLLDPNELSDMAWQLFFGELREEGLALVDDAEAEKLTNRCFKLTEIFLRTRQRRLNQLFGGGSMMTEERQRDEARAPLPPKPKVEVPIEKRLPDDPSHLSKLETEALIEEAQEIAEQPHRLQAGTEPPVTPPEVSSSPGTKPPEAPIPAEPPSADD